VFAVLCEAFEKAATLRTLVVRVDVGELFEQLDDAEPLPLGSRFTKPAVVRHG
jgi:hypothetical protein